MAKTRLNTTSLIFLVLFFSSCSNNISKHDIKDSGKQCSSWTEISATMKQADTLQGYDYFIEKLGRPLDEYVTPSLPEEYVVYYSIPNIPDSVFWIMLDSKTKKYLYWSAEKFDKKTSGIRAKE